MAKGSIFSKKDMPGNGDTKIADPVSDSMPAPDKKPAPVMPASHAGPPPVYEEGKENPVAPKAPATYEEFLNDYSYAGPR
jgi:hypothetical protein